MSVFIDTNVLLRSVQPSHPMHAAAVRAVAGFIRDGEALVVTPQVVAEFWNVATRPTDNNGLGFAEEVSRLMLDCESDKVVLARCRPAVSFGAMAKFLTIHQYARIGATARLTELYAD